MKIIIKKTTRLAFAYTAITILLPYCCNLKAQVPEKNIHQNTFIKKENLISEAYLKLWNPEIQKKIDNNIEH